MRPNEIKISKDKKTLTLLFSNKNSVLLSAEVLRVMSPSAEVQGHSSEQRVTVGGKKNVEIMTVDPVGNYALRIGFDDMHSTGIFTWSYLNELHECGDHKWAEYLQELEDKGLSR